MAARLASSAARLAAAAAASSWACAMAISRARLIVLPVTTGASWAILIPQQFLCSVLGVKRMGPRQVLIGHVALPPARK
eukprot:CAMPEP_0206249008 /NCGR_PEP_ID=MMETSP0047_2-20121206/20678_1 /ASSEMBLY_ACC=CAM_ASM_000192 /TAXON_ID=195065 /ORGANISM="Chroomonas mesostigmatica_cf, Strain CCMP1168" /LENGTH=78 /DNA_ID=CAMNT_0053674699 /DNA_START=304 /DNA_END=536 /DNA_ORIENTATION=-